MDARVRQLVQELKAGLQVIYGGRLRNVYLYGSYARGEQDGESDVDILVVLDRVERYGAEVDRTGELVSTVALNHGLSISRVFVSEQDWVTGRPPFVAMVQTEAIAT